MNELTTHPPSLSGFLRLEQVLQLIPVSKATWWNGCKSGRFPPPFKLAPRITAWKASDIHQWIEQVENSKASRTN
ncbi:helix-turn-helix transcriptional regulator [Larkinella sp.]|uniref:helix-turn-helix transcriptional regulator n=1 Tax=Larkinella sp. TaxID=2034517 RepID=UPI003BAD6FEA